MHKVSRSLLLAGVLAFGTLTAACGDEVTVNPGGGITGVQSVVVTPPSATIAQGSSITLAVSVVADAATAKTVTWTTSSSTVATVDATGKVTGVAAGTATIIATSTADATKAAASVITVTGTGPVNTVNTVAISTVTKGGLPVQLNNVFGQVDVTLFISGPGGTLNLIQNCTPNGATSTTGDVIVAQQQVAGSQNQSPVTLSYNTAATGTVTNGIAVVNNASNTPIFLNGNCVLKAQLGTAVATNVTPITLNNASRYNVTIATSGPSAISGVNGLNYLSGDLTATINPVNYVSATPLASISGTFAGRTFTQVAPAAGTQTFTVTFPGAIVAGGTAVPALSISDYTSPAAGDFLTVTSSVTTAGANGFVTGGPDAGPIRVDNGTPNTPTLAQINSATNWINASYTFVTGATKYVNAAGDQGTPTTGTNTDVVTFGYAPAAGITTLSGNANYGIATGFGIGPTQCSTTGWTIVTSSANIPKSTLANTNTAYRARAFETDKIGNVKCADLDALAGSPNAVIGGATRWTFGVDPDAPFIAQATGPTGGSPTASTATNTAQGRIVTGTAATFSFSDSLSGFVLNRQIQYSLNRNFTATTANCVVIIDGVNANQTGTTANGCTGTLNSAPSIILDGNTNVEAYYNLTAKSVDQAGNFSTTLTRVYLLDNTVPVVQGISIPQNLTGGVSQTFLSTATDNVDLKSSNFNITYTAATAGATLYYSGDNYGPNYDATLVTSSAVNATVPFFIKQLQGTAVGGAPVALTAADSGEAQQINVRAIDAANQTSVASVAAIPNINISSSAGFTAGTEFNTFNVTNAATNVSNGTGTTVSKTISLTADAVLTSATAQNATVPFAQVCFFYQQTAAGFAADNTIPAGALVQIGCVAAPSITDVAGVSRTWTYTLAGFDPPAALGLGGAGSAPIYAVGVRSTGVGILSQANNNITLVN